MNRLTNGLMIIAIGAGMSHSIQAPDYRDSVGPGDKDAKWVVGAAAYTSSNPYTGETEDSYFSPSIKYNGEKFFVNGANASLGYSIAKWGNLSAGVIAGMNLSFLAKEEDFRDNALLNGLNERDNTVDGGFYVNHTTDLGRFNVTVLTDLAGKHDGQSVGASYTMDFTAGDWSINPTVGVQWLSNNIVNHNFGVDATEATAFRSAYDAGPAVNWNAGIRGRYDITENWDLNLAAGVTRLDSSITNSSIIDDDYVSYGSISVGYSF